MGVSSADYSRATWFVYTPTKRPFRYIYRPVHETVTAAAGQGPCLAARLSTVPIIRPYAAETLDGVQASRLHA